jgi:hypothetical protein
MVCKKVIRTAYLALFTVRQVRQNQMGTGLVGRAALFVVPGASVETS